MMHVHDVIDLYDSNPNMTLAYLARISGRTVADLKHILLQPKPETDYVAAYIAEGLGEY
jgi:hypothetical protein